MDKSFTLIDLISHAGAVQLLLKGLSEEEKVNWLSSRGDLWQLPVVHGSRRTYLFESTLGLRCVFMIEKDDFFFYYGDHQSSKGHD